MSAQKKKKNIYENLGHHSFKEIERNESSKDILKMNFWKKKNQEWGKWEKKEFVEVLKDR